MKKLFILMALLTGMSSLVQAQSSYWQRGWNCIYGHRLPEVGHYAYDYFVKGEQEGEEGCARVVVAGLTLLDPTPGRNRSEIVRLIGKWYKQDEKISLMAAGFYLPKNTIDPGEIILSWHYGTPEKYKYVPGQLPNLKQSLFYAKYAYENLNSGDGDSERFYKLLLAYCYEKGACGYAKDERKAARIALSMGNTNPLKALISKAESLDGLESLMTESLGDQSVSSYTDLNSCYKARKAELTDRFFAMSREQMATTWASYPSKVKTYLNQSLEEYSVSETNFQTLTRVLDSYPDQKTVQGVRQRLAGNYVKKANNLIASTSVKPSEVKALREFGNSLKNSSLLSTRQADSVETVISKAFAKDVTARAERTFSESNISKTSAQGLFDYTNALIEQGYVQQNQAAASVQNRVSRFFTRRSTDLRTVSASSTSTLKSKAQTLHTQALTVRRAAPSWLGDVPSLNEADKLAIQAIAYSSASQSSQSRDYRSFLDNNPDAPSEYIERATEKYNELLAQEQDDAAFEAAYALTKTPSPSEKKAILSMPMSSTMASTIAPMLTGKYIRQHQKNWGSDSFLEATKTHGKTIDWNTGGPLTIEVGGILGAIKGEQWKYGANGVYGGLTYNFNLVSFLGLETGAYYIFELGKYIDKELDIEEGNGLTRHAVSVPLHLTFGADRPSRSMVTVVFHIGPSFRYNFVAKGYYGGTYYPNLYEGTSWFRPFDVRLDMALSMSVSHFNVSVGTDYGFMQSSIADKSHDYRIRFGLGVVF